MNKLVDKFEAGSEQQGKKELPIKTGPQQGNNQTNHVKKEEGFNNPMTVIFRIEEKILWSLD